jgi:hypothetical protein
MLIAILTCDLVLTACSKDDAVETPTDEVKRN